MTQQPTDPLGSRKRACDKPPGDRRYCRLRGRLRQPASCRLEARRACPVARCSSPGLEQASLAPRRTACRVKTVGRSNFLRNVLPELALERRQNTVAAFCSGRRDAVVVSEVNARRLRRDGQKLAQRQTHLVMVMPRFQMRACTCWTSKHVDQASHSERLNCHVERCGAKGNERSVCDSHDASLQDKDTICEGGHAIASPCAAMVAEGV